MTPWSARAGASRAIHGVARDRGGPYTWESPVIGHGWALPHEMVAEMSSRLLALTPADAIGTVRMLSLRGEVSVEPDLEDVTPDTQVVVGRGAGLSAG